MNTTELIDNFKKTQIGAAVSSFSGGIKGPGSGIELIKKLSNNSNKIIGLPPITAYHSLFQSQISGRPFNSEIEIKTENDWHVLASSTILRLIPAIPKFSGISEASNSGEIFSMDYNLGAKKYVALLKNAGVDPRFVNQSTNRRAAIDVAVLSNFSLSESFNSTYEESMLEGAANTASNMVNQIRPLAPEIGDVAKKVGESTGKALSSMLGMVGLDSAANAASNVATTASMVAGGNKVDFPQIWSSSSYSPSYKFTTLLYNPWPDDPSIGNEDYCYNKYIVEPLAHLMGFVMPISADGISYTYPVLCGAYGGGLFNVNAGYIETLDINVGGGAADISFLQRPNIIEVDFTIRHLYSTMIGYVSDEGGLPKQISEERPSFKGFVAGLRSFAIVESKEHNLNDNLINTLVRAADEIENIVRRDQPADELLFDSDGRLSIEDEVNASDPTLLDESELTPEQLQNVQQYKRDVNLIIESGLPLTSDMQIALRIRNNIPISERVSTSFNAKRQAGELSNEVNQVINGIPIETINLTGSDQSEQIQSTVSEGNI